MTYDEFKRHVGKAGLTLKAFAELIKSNPASISNHARHGEVPSHLAVIVVLLAELAERKIDFKDVIDKIDFAPKKARGAGIGKFGGDRQNLLFDTTLTQTNHD